MSKTPIRKLSNVDLWIDQNTKDYFFRLEYDIDDGRYKEIFPKVHTGLKLKDPQILRPDLEPYYTSIIGIPLYIELEILTGSKGGLLIYPDDDGHFSYIIDTEKTKVEESILNKILDMEPDQNAFDYFKRLGSDINSILQAFEQGGLSREEAFNIFLSLSRTDLESQVDAYMNDKKE